MKMYMFSEAAADLQAFYRNLSSFCTCIFILGLWFDLYSNNLIFCL